MLISYNWLQKYFKNKPPSPEKISEELTFHSFEVENFKKIKEDMIFDIDILPDRAHDCLSHLGIAKEISVIFDLEIKPELRLEFGQEVGPQGSPRSDLGIQSNLEIQNESEKCRRYVGRIIKNIKVGPSPDWLRKSLESIKQRSINNIVDITNYVMFDLGNPIHAFDLDKLESSKIIIRSAKKGEKIITLDKKEVELDESIMIIADEKDPIAIAGVKGGMKAEVGNDTKNIIIEVANFDPIAVRRAAKKLNIFTDSAKRFENEISPALGNLVMNKISNLILEVTEGKLEEIIDNYPKKIEIRKVKFSSKYVNELLGTKITDKEIEEILNRYQYIFSHMSDMWEVEVPVLRLDIMGPQDMVEEIGRMYGYDKIKSEIPKIDFKPQNDPVWAQMNQARAILIENRYREVMNYTFTNKGEVEILAGASDKSFLRTNLSDGIKKSYELNLKNLPLIGDDEVKIFEIGTIFSKRGEQLNVCFTDGKDIQEMSLGKFIEKNSLREEIGLGSEVGPRAPLRSNLEEQKDFHYFKPWSSYPFITRDIAVWVPSYSADKPEVNNLEKLSQIYKEFGTELLVCEPKLFDQFTKPAKEEGEIAQTSYAFRLVFQSYKKTLTDEEVNIIMSNIEEKISSFGWIVR